MPGCYRIVDDKREQIGLAKALGHSIGAIAQAIAAEIDSSANSPAISCRVDATRASRADLSMRRRREALIERDRAYEPSLSTPAGVDRSKSGWLRETNVVCSRECETIYAFISGSKGRAVWRYLRVVTNAAAAIRRRKIPQSLHPRTARLTAERGGQEVTHQ